MKKTLFFLICLLAFGVTCFSQKKPDIQLFIDKTIVEEGVPITVTFKTNENGKLVFNFPKDFKKLNQSKTVNQGFNRKTGKPYFVYSLSQAGVFSKKGKYKIQAIFMIGNKHYKSNVVRVKVVKKTPSHHDEGNYKYAFNEKVSSES